MLRTLAIKQEFSSGHALATVSRESQHPQTLYRLVPQDGDQPVRRWSQNGGCFTP